MILLLALPFLALVAVVHRYLQVCAPSNVLARRVRAAAPSLGLAATLFVWAVAISGGMAIVWRLVASGAPGWLNLVLLWLAWDASKLAVLAVLVAVRCALVPQSGSRVFT